MIVEKKFKSKCFYVNKEEQLLISNCDCKSIFYIEALSQQTEEKAAERMNLDHSI